MAQPPDQRETFVAEASKDNTELRDEVLSLLRAQAKAENFMERSAMKVAAAALAQQDSNLTTSFSLVGRELASYKIEKLLGAGGMGEVYLARDSKLDRLVALKILPAHFVADRDRTTRFKREARALSSLNHPNLLTIYEVGEADGLHFIAMEFVDGQTLSSLREGLSLRGLLAIVGQVAEALSAAHKAGIVHRDIKPENVMVRHDGYAKVLDFGLVKLGELATGRASLDGHKTQHGVTMGTLAYMSPEQAAGEPVDHRTDIWSLGVVLYEIATGHRPFKGETRQATVNAILANEPTSPSAIDATLPVELDKIVEKVLEKDRDLRYQNASDLRTDIRRLLRTIDSGVTSSNPRAITSSFPSLVKRRWFWPVAVAGLLLCLAIPTAWYFVKARASGPDWSKAAHVQLTSFVGTEYFPSLSPDGKDFVYAREDPPGNFDLYLQRVGGKNVTKLTPTTTTDENQPAFSPDGELIAFRSNREPAGVYVMERTGENPRLVIAGCYMPSWSPDGKQLVCSTSGQSLPSIRNSRPSKLLIVDVETGANRQLCENDAMQPAWSPSGARIAFWFMPPSSGRSDIATISKLGGEIEVITKDASTNWNPVWSPDGKYLYFASDRSGNMGFWRVLIDEETGKVQGEPEAVVTPSPFNRHLNFSRDGRRMIYVQTDQKANIHGLNFDPVREKVVGEPFWITRGDQQLARPELSPDGTQFVIRVQRRTQDDIVVVQRDGTNFRDITNDRFFDRYPSWSPDGKRIAFTSDRSGVYEIWTINADGTDLRQHSFDSPGASSFPQWSPDGSRMVFRRHDVNVIVEVNKPWKEQTPQKLPTPPLPFVIWDWSPDGKKLLGTFSDAKVWCFSLETNQYEKLSDFGAYPKWLADSVRFVTFTGGKIYLGNAKTKQMQELIPLPETQIRSVGISQDTKLIYYAASSTESNIWLLDLASTDYTDKNQ